MLIDIITAIRTTFFFSDLWDVIFGQGGTWNLGSPHKPSLNMKDWLVKFAKGPPEGISPVNSLRETLKILKYLFASRDFGIDPERLL